MKRKLLLISASLFSFFACTTHTKVPSEILTSFEKNFPNIEVEEWEKESATEWEAEFEMNGIEYSANFDNEGKLLETEHEISSSDLPWLVTQTIASTYGSYKLLGSELVEKNGQIFYELELSKEKQNYEILLDQKGIVLQEEYED